MRPPGWAHVLAGPGGDAELVARVVALAVTGAGAPQRQRRAALALLERDGAAEPPRVLAELERAAARLWREPADEAGHRLAALGARVLVLGQPGYPDRLAQLWPELGPPLWLFAWPAGALAPCARAAADPAAHAAGHRHPAVAVVGTRHPSVDGLEIAHELGRLLARNGVVVVSGMARGVDEAAHEGALAAGGRTVAVLGTGFGVDYPRGRGPLRERIAASGGLVTELAPGAPPRGHQFLERNRVIAALADAVVVVEGQARSGALATARLAAEQGRDVWAVPGSPLQPTARAPLDLIRDGARPLTRLDDVLEGLGGGAGAPRCPGAHGGPGAGAREPVPSGPDGRRAATGPNGRTPPGSPGGRPAPGDASSVVAAALTGVPASADALRRATELPLPAVLSALAELTAQGRASTTPRGWVAAGRG